MPKLSRRCMIEPPNKKSCISHIRTCANFGTKINRARTDHCTPSAAHSEYAAVRGVGLPWTQASHRGRVAVPGAARRRRAPATGQGTNGTGLRSTAGHLMLPAMLGGPPAVCETQWSGSWLTVPPRARAHHPCPVMSPLPPPARHALLFPVPPRRTDTGTM